MNKKKLLIIIIGGTIASAFITVALAAAGMKIKSGFTAEALRFFSIAAHKAGFTPCLTPWAAIGGCGASSGSVSSDMQLKWIGNGISGALFDMEAMYAHSQITDTAGTLPAQEGLLKYSTNSLLVSLFWRPLPYTVKLSVPLSIKQGWWKGSSYNVGTLSDLSLDISRKWGMTGALGTALVLNFPAGRSDIPDLVNRTQLAPPHLQMGSGVFGGSLRLNTDIDRDWGMISLGSYYSGGVFAFTTDDYSFDTVSMSPVSVKKSFKLCREGWGAINDQGTVIPDIVTVFSDIMVKASSIAHGFSMLFSLPLRNGRWQNGIDYLTDWSSTSTTAARYFPTKSMAQQYADTVHKDGVIPQKQYQNPVIVGTWQNGSDQCWVVRDNTWIELKSYPGVSLQYSLEKSDAMFPFFFGGIIRYEFDNGIKFSGFGAGLGIKYPVY
jgi:hypothetical protein